MMLRAASVLAFTALTRLAAAQEAAPAEADEATREQARAVFAEGVTALEGGDCPGALEHFRRAYGMIHEPSILYNLATAEAECHDEVEAAVHYRQFLAEARTGRAARFRGDAQRQLRAIERRLGRIDLTIAGLETGDVVLLGDRRLDPAALTDVEAVEGEHLVTVRRGEVEVASGRVTVVARQDAPLALTVVYTPPPTPAEVARAAETPTEDDDPLRTRTDPRRRRILIGSTSAAAAVFTTLVVVYSVR